MVRATDWTSPKPAYQRGADDLHLPVPSRSATTKLAAAAIHMMNAAFPYPCIAFNPSVVVAGPGPRNEISMRAHGSRKKINKDAKEEVMTMTQRRPRLMSEPYNPP
jgi:hypothetical protein